MVILMFGYAIHRFLNEMLRSDNEIWPDGLTLSQNISILVFVAGDYAAVAVVAHARRSHRPSRELERSEDSALSRMVLPPPDASALD